MNCSRVIVVILLVMLFIALCKLYNGYKYVKTEMYFGRNRTDGTSVSHAEFHKFLNELMTPLFPMGFTVHDTNGQMFDGKHIEKELSFVVVIVHEPTVSYNEKVAKAVDSYKTHFKTTHVMHTQHAIDATFHHRYFGKREMAAAAGN